ncbi:MAG: hypothetical protein NWE93_04680 [Candidatus Bathyarchaeota archaeon]|nr:hypothetical protein [Candidatus Bathyarchaeota archaeon]
MSKLDWKVIESRFCSNSISKTKTGKSFKVLKITKEEIIIDLPAKEQYVSRKNLEKAVELLSQGTVIGGPADYRRLVADERPAYAWAILRDFGFVK